MKYRPKYTLVLCSFVIVLFSGCVFASSEEYTQDVQCPQCYGTGQWNLMPGDVMAYMQCPLCNGTGNVEEETAVKYVQFQNDPMQGGPAGGHFYQGAGSGKSEIQCPICSGSGNCRFCGGKGWQAYTTNNIINCDQCHGSGRCADCHGKGSIWM